MTTATVASEQLLLDEASNYLSRRADFADLYYLAGDLVAEFIHDAHEKRTVEFIGAILAAEVDYQTDDDRRSAVMRALLAQRGIDIRSECEVATATASRVQIAAA